MLVDLDLHVVERVFCLETGLLVDLSPTQPRTAFFGRGLHFDNYIYIAVLHASPSDVYIPVYMYDWT